VKLQQKVIKNHLENRQFEAAFHQIAKLDLDKSQQEQLLELAQYRSRIKETEGFEKRASLESILAETLSNFVTNLQQKKSFDFTAPLFVLIVMLGLEILSYIFCELNPLPTKTPLINAVGPNWYHFIWIILIASTSFFLIYAFLVRNKYRNYFITDTELSQVKSNLRKRYSAVLHKNTSFPLPLNLEIQLPNNKNESQQIQPSLFNWYKLLKTQGSLAFIGEMGLGKTTQLNKLAIDWLNETNHIEIPFIFNLRSFFDSDKPFLTWLLDYLDDVYGLPNQMAEELIDSHHFLPIFDGLDELYIRENNHSEIFLKHQKCLEAIQEFISQNKLPYYVVSLKKYEQLQKSICSFNSLVNFKTSNNIEIKTAIEQNKNLKKAYESNAAITEIANNLFYCNILNNVSNKEEITYPEDKDDLKHFLLDKYINNQLNNDSRHPKLKHFLTWTASIIDKENLEQFELTSFQKHHIKHEKLVNILGSLVYFLFAIIICLVFILNIFDFNNLEIDDKIFFLFLGCLTMGLSGFAGFSIFNLFQTTQPKQIEEDSLFRDDWFINPFKIKKIRLGHYLKSLKWIENIAKGVVTGVASCILLLIFNFLFDESPEKPTLFYSIVVLINMLIFLIGGSVSHPTFTSSNNPYFKLTWDIPVRLVVLILSFVFIFEFIDIFYLSLSNIIKSLISLILVGFIGLSFFYHIILRLSVRLVKKFPLTWVKLLNQATDANILEQQNGQWRFRHQIIEDYFLREWRKNNGE